MDFQLAMKITGYSYATLARETGIGRPTLYRLVALDDWPKRQPRARVMEILRKAFGKRNLVLEDLAARVPSRRLQAELNLEEIELMQLDTRVMDLFALRRNPFLNDVEDEEDVFQFKGHEQVTQAIRDAINERGFLAVSAPSGAGKTTIWDGIESEYLRDQSVVICRPLLKDKEKLSPAHLCRALIYGLLGDDAKVRQDAEDQGRQLSNALRALRTGMTDRKAVLVVDDAHFSGTSVLRQLKTFYEEKVGRYRLLGIVLIGLPKLKQKLSDFPEIGNRIRLVEVPPVPVQAYLDFKLKRAGSSMEKLFDPSGAQAFVDRFKQPRKAAVEHPLIINATCIRAMCKLFELGALPGARITGDVIAQLPSEGAIRRAVEKERAA